ncbi:MAG TPA: hypothetical protein VMX77_01290 [Candidatus Bathyarchaeia archaeon]|nr:hypothetical protein [Candidatus Bathyarchaeia archaeon]
MTFNLKQKILRLSVFIILIFILLIFLLSGKPKFNSWIEASSLFPVSGPVIHRGGTLAEVWQEYENIPPTSNLDAQVFIDGNSYVVKDNQYWYLAKDSNQFVSGSLTQFWGSEINHPPIEKIDVWTITPDGSWIVTKNGSWWLKSLGTNQWSSGTLAEIWQDYTNIPPTDGIDTQVYFSDWTTLITKGGNYWRLRANSKVFESGTLKDLWKEYYVHPPTDGIDVYTITGSFEVVTKDTLYWVLDNGERQTKTWKSGNDYFGQREPYPYYDSTSGWYYLFYDGQEVGGENYVVNTISVAKSRSPLGPWIKKPVKIEGVIRWWETYSIGSPCIFKEGNYYYMFYLASAGVYNPDEPLFKVGGDYRIGLARATTLDGSWIKLKGDGTLNPTSSNDKPLLPRGIEDDYWDNIFNTSFVSLLKKDGQFFLFYTGHGDRGFGVGLARASSILGPYQKLNPPGKNDNIIIPPEEMVENLSLYFDQPSNSWFLFGNYLKIGCGCACRGGQGTVVYRTQDPFNWDISKKKYLVMVDENYPCPAKPYEDFDIYNQQSSQFRGHAGVPGIVKDPQQDQLYLYFDANDFNMADQNDPQNHFFRDLYLMQIPIEQLRALLPLGESFIFLEGWNEITWPAVTGIKASDIPPECPIAVAKENSWWKPYVKNYGGLNFEFEGGKIYYLKCNQVVVWSL